eukprot:UN13618
MLCGAMLCSLYSILCVVCFTIKMGYGQMLCSMFINYIFFYNNPKLSSFNLQCICVFSQYF